MSLQITKKITSVAVVPPFSVAAKPKLPDRPAALAGTTYKLKTPLSEHALYITVNDIDVNGVKRPFEVFINSKAMEQFQWIVALTRLVSAVFRHAAATDGDVAFLTEELQSVFDPKAGYFKGKRYIPSLVAEIGSVIEQHIQSTVGPKTVLLPQVSIAPSHQAEGVGDLCHKCHHMSVVVEGGCQVCKNCGDSRCS